MIEIKITANNEVEYRQALEMLGATQAPSIMSDVQAKDVKVTPKVPEKKEQPTGEKSPQTKASEKSAKKIEPEVAKKTRYFKHEETGKPFVIEKGKGLPVEAIELGAASELTKAEYDKLTKKKEETVKDDEELSPESMRKLVKAGADLNLHKQIKAVFAEVDSSDGKFGGVDASRYAELKEKLEALIAEAK